MYHNVVNTQNSWNKTNFIIVSPQSSLKHIQIEFESFVGAVKT